MFLLEFLHFFLLKIISHFYLILSTCDYSFFLNLAFLPFFLLFFFFLNNQFSALFHNYIPFLNSQFYLIKSASIFLFFQILFLIFFSFLSFLFVRKWLGDFVLHILPFGLVRLRTFNLTHGLVRCNMSAGVHTRAVRMCHSEMSKQKSQIVNVTGECE